METTVSIIIPTHNRSAALKTLLERLAQQTYPLHLLEVIAVANGCTDDTVGMLKNYTAPYHLRYIEQEGRGPAVARNTGAATATSDLLLFLDDDIDPSEGLVAAHVEAHNKKENSVVIGYLPLVIPAKPGFHHLQLRAWWEEKFQHMANPGYWYSYEDLLSGNFSLSATLFQRVGAFDNTLQCREDYELGVRLIKAGAQFQFSKRAWGYHRDGAANLGRSFRRKRQEGKADVQFANTHPEMLSRLKLASLRGAPTFSRKLWLFLSFHMPALTDSVAGGLQRLMNGLEYMRWRGQWKKWNIRLHDYWYIRGVVDGIGSRQNLTVFFQKHPFQKRPVDMELDLKAGITAAERQLDASRPASVHLRWAEQPVGTINNWPGAERLRGAHLRPMLATRFSWSLMQALTLAQAFEKNTTDMAVVVGETAPLPH